MSAERFLKFMTYQPENLSKYHIEYFLRDVFILLFFILLGLMISYCFIFN